MCAFLAIFVDGENVFAFYAPKAEIYRADDMSPGRHRIARRSAARRQAAAARLEHVDLRGHPAGRVGPQVR